MEYVKKIEAGAASLFARAPALPGNARRWVAKNAWWIIIVFAVMEAFNVIGSLRNLNDIAARHSQANIYIREDFGVYTVMGIIGLAVSVAVTALYFGAVRPLREGRKSGWTMVFVGMLLGAAYAVASLIVTIAAVDDSIVVLATVIGFVFGMAFTVVWLYFLFQIRGEFGGRVANAKEAEIVTGTAAKKAAPKKAAGKSAKK